MRKSIRKTSSAMLSVVLALSVSLMVGGCATVSGIEKIGDEASKGNIGTAAWYTLMGIPMMLIVDTFTLGGLLSPNDVATIGGGAINTAAAQKQQQAEINRQHQSIQVNRQPITYGSKSDPDYQRRHQNPTSSGTATGIRSCEIAGEGPCVR